MRRAFVIGALFAAGFGVSQFAASAPPAGFCERKPSHPKCQTTSSTAPTSSTVPTTVPPPTTTTAPPTTGEARANIWVTP